MSMPRKYRVLVGVLAFALLLGLADKAFSYRLANFATTVVADLIEEVAELTSPESPSPQAMAPARAIWDASRFQFPSAAEFPAAYGAFGYEDQPSISLGTPLVLDLDSTRGQEKSGPTSTALFPNPGAGQGNVARQRLAGSGGMDSGGTSSGGGAARLMASAVAALQGPQAETADSATSSADVATTAVESPDTSLAARLWSDLEASGAAGGSGASGGSSGSIGSNGSDGELSTDPNAGDIGAFADIANAPVSPSDLVAPGSLTEALALDSATGGPGLDVPTVLEVGAVLDLPGTAPANLGLDWLRDLKSDAAAASKGAPDLSPAGESSRPENAVAVISEPAMMTVFGVGLLALAGRLRSKLRRARS